MPSRPSQPTGRDQMAAGGKQQARGGGGEDERGGSPAPPAGGRLPGPAATRVDTALPTLPRERRAKAQARERSAARPWGFRPRGAS